MTVLLLRQKLEFFAAIFACTSRTKLIKFSLELTKFYWEAHLIQLGGSPNSTGKLTKFNYYNLSWWYYYK